MFLNEGLGAQELGLFCVGEQEDHVVAQRRIRREGTRSLEQCRHGCPVVVSTRAGRHRIIVGSQHHRLTTTFAASCALDSDEHVLGCTHVERGSVLLIYYCGRLHLRVEPERLQLVEDVFAYPSVLRRAYGVWLLADAIHVLHSSGGRKLLGWSIQRLCGGRLRAVVGRKCGARRQQQGHKNTGRDVSSHFRPLRPDTLTHQDTRGGSRPCKVSIGGLNVACNWS